MKPVPRVLIFTGDGKGKTTAALGMVLRAHGHGMPACIIQFIKHDDSVGEVRALRRLAGVELIQTGLGFVPPSTSPRFAEHKAAAEAGLERARQVIVSGEHPVIVLDEICNAVAKGLLAEQAVVDVVRLARTDECIVLTGRGATEGLIAIADTVTEMRCIKHALQAGRAAQKGVEL